MNEAELDLLRKELRDHYRELEKEATQIEKDVNAEDKFFSRARKRARAAAKQNSLKELMEATKEFREAIAVGSTKTPAEQEAACENLKKLEDKYNYKDSNCKYKLKNVIRNTLTTLHNRSVKKNYEKPVKTGLIKTAIAFIPLVAIPLLPAIGLSAVAGALATPLAWLGGGLLVRSVAHMVSGVVRKLGVKEALKSDKKATYDSLYPTQSEVKGLFSTYSYNKEQSKTAGKMFESLNSLKEFKEFKGGEIAPVTKTGEETGEEKTDEKNKTKEKEATKEDLVVKYAEFVKNTTLKTEEDIDKLEKDGLNISAHITPENKEIFDVTSLYLKLARKIITNTNDEEFATMMAILDNEESYKSKEAKEYQLAFAAKLVDLAKSLGNYDTLIKPFMPEEEKTGEKGKGGEGSGGKEGSGSGEDHGSGSGSDDDPTKGKGEKGDGGRKPAPVEPVGESIAKSSEAISLLRELREFDVATMTVDNYNKANRLIAKIEKELRVHPDDLQLSVDDEMDLAEVRSMADAYEAKTALVDKLKICEAAMNVGKFYKEAFEDCIKEFYNIVGHTTFVNDDGKRTSVRAATSRNLLSVSEYERVKNVLNYYKKTMDYDASVSLSNTTKFAQGQVNREEYMRDMEEAFGGRKRGK